MDIGRSVLLSCCSILPRAPAAQVAQGSPEGQAAANSGVGVPRGGGDLLLWAGACAERDVGPREFDSRTARRASEFPVSPRPTGKTGRKTGIS